MHERSLSPSVELERAQPNQPLNTKKGSLAYVSHKRVKSDVTESSISNKEQPITSNIYVKHNNPIILQG